MNNILTDPKLTWTSQSPLLQQSGDDNPFTAEFEVNFEDSEFSKSELPGTEYKFDSWLFGIVIPEGSTPNFSITGIDKSGDEVDGIELYELKSDGNTKFSIEVSIDKYPKELYVDVTQGSPSEVAEKSRKTLPFKGYSPNPSDGFTLVIYQKGIRITHVTTEEGVIEVKEPIISNIIPGGSSSVTMKPSWIAKAKELETPAVIEVETVTKAESIESVVDYDDEGNPIYGYVDSGFGTAQASEEDTQSSAESGSADIPSPRKFMMRSRSSSNQSSEPDYTTEASPTEMDNVVYKAYQDTKFKIPAGVLKTLFATKAGVLQELLKIPEKQVNCLLTGVEYKLKYIISQTRVNNLINRIKEQVDKDGDSNPSLKKELITLLMSAAGRLDNLGGFDEEYYIESNGEYAEGDKINTKKFPRGCVFNTLIDNGWIDATTKSIHIKEDSEDYEAFKFLNEGVSSTSYVRFRTKKYVPGYDYYSLENGEYVPYTGLDESNFDPNKVWYAGIQDNLDPLKSAMNSAISSMIDTLVENKSLYEEYNKVGKTWSNWKPVKDSSNKYVMTPHKFYVEGLKKHRVKQVVMMETKDAIRFMNSNFFAVQWNSAGESMKSTAAEFMSKILEAFKQLPKMILSAAQAIVEPMCAIVVTPLGPGGVTANIMQVMGTVTNIVNAVQATTANIVAISSYAAILGLNALPVMAPIVGTISIITLLCNTLNSIVSALPAF